MEVAKPAKSIRRSWRHQGTRSSGRVKDQTASPTFWESALEVLSFMNHAVWWDI